MLDVLYLKDHRQAAGLTRRALEDASGISQRQIEYLEKAVKSPTLKTLEALAEALGIKVADLLAPPKKNGRKRRAS